MQVLAASESRDVGSSIIILALSTIYTHTHTHTHTLSLSLSLSPSPSLSLPLSLSLSLSLSLPLLLPLLLPSKTEQTPYYQDVHNIRNHIPHRYTPPQPPSPSLRRQPFPAGMRICVSSPILTQHSKRERLLENINFFVYELIKARTCIPLSSSPVSAFFISLFY